MSLTGFSLIALMTSPFIIPAFAAGPSHLEISSTSNPYSVLLLEGTIPKLTLNFLGAPICPSLGPAF